MKISPNDKNHNFNGTEKYIGKREKKLTTIMNMVQLMYNSTIEDKKKKIQNCLNLNRASLKN